MDERLQHSQIATHVSCLVFHIDCLTFSTTYNILHDDFLYQSYSQSMSSYYTLLTAQETRGLFLLLDLRHDSMRSFHRYSWFCGFGWLLSLERAYSGSFSGFSRLTHQSTKNSPGNTSVLWHESIVVSSLNPSHHSVWLWKGSFSRLFCTSIE